MTWTLGIITRLLLAPTASHLLHRAHRGLRRQSLSQARSAEICLRPRHRVLVQADQSVACRRVWHHHRAARPGTSLRPLPFGRPCLTPRRTVVSADPRGCRVRHAVDKALLVWARLRIAVCHRSKNQLTAQTSRCVQEQHWAIPRTNEPVCFLFPSETKKIKPQRRRNWTLGHPGGHDIHAFQPLSRGSLLSTHRSPANTHPHFLFYPPVICCLLMHCTSSWPRYDLRLW